MPAPFYCLFVASFDRFLTKVERLHIETYKRLCKEFGGKFIRVRNDDKAMAIAAVARNYHISQIVIGESQRSR
ncbi:hypothetical protein [Phormidium sp. FACHB-592]|uniref:Anticodon-binding domain-containing protein n=1 Tax=Stenomitos frigidus AS-A4 TaxID=2933935 RepID=A0ABV0KPY7_9CYAN